VYNRKPKTRNAWLITWESSRDDYMRDLNRPRVVAILKPQYDSSTIKRILPALYTSEKALTFSEKIGHSFSRRSPSWLRDEEASICCGGNPWLRARLVKDLYVQTYSETDYRETLHWREPAHRREDPDTYQLMVVHPERQCAEDVHFDTVWYGRSFLEKEKKALMPRERRSGSAAAAAELAR
jgi:hypothetical protein